MGEDAGDESDKVIHYFCGKPYMPEKEEVYLVSNGMMLMSYFKAGKLQDHFRMITIVVELWETISKDKCQW